MRDDRETISVLALSVANVFLQRWSDPQTLAGADDIAQETVLEVVRCEPELRHAGALPAFVRTVARRCRHRTLAREQQRGDRAVPLSADALAVAPPDDWAASLQIGSCDVPIEWCLAQLPSVLARLGRLNRSLMESYYEGFTCAELAERYGLTAQAVKVRLYRGRRRIQAEFERRVRVGSCRGAHWSRLPHTNQLTESKGTRPMTKHDNHPESHRPAPTRGLLRPLRAALLCALALATTPLVAQQPAAVTPDGKAALRQAAQLAKAISGTEGAVREAAFGKAIAAYTALQQSSLLDPSQQAEAYYRAGELLRRQGSLDDAEVAYGQAIERAPVRFAERAGAARADVLRRLKRWEQALEGYRTVAAMSTGTNRVHQARCWVGRVLEQMDNVDAAIESYEAALGVTQKPVHVIELCNWMAKAHVARGAFDAADAALARAEKVLPPGDSPEAARARKAFERMSARRALQRARDKAQGAATDAQDIEGSRRRAGG